MIGSSCKHLLSTTRITLHGNKNANIKTKSLVLYDGKTINKTVSATNETVTIIASKTYNNKQWCVNNYYTIKSNRTII